MTADISSYRRTENRQGITLVGVAIKIYAGRHVTTRVWSIRYTILYPVADILVG